MATRAGEKLGIWGLGNLQQDAYDFLFTPECTVCLVVLYCVFWVGRLAYGRAQSAYVGWQKKKGERLTPAQEDQLERVRIVTNEMTKLKKASEDSRQ